MGKRILFRVDAGQSIGLGHYYRSYNLAKHLQSRGHYICFIHRPSDFWNNIISDGVPFDVEELGINEEQQMLNLITRGNFDLFYVDGILQFSNEFISCLKESCKVVFYQNLSASRFYADVYILPSLNSDEAFFDGFTPNSKVFKGLKYLLFNEKISSLKTMKSAIANEVRNIAIISGGSDPKNILMGLYGMIDYSQFPDIGFNFFIGEDFIHKDSIPANPIQNTVFMKFNHEQILTNDLLVSVFGVSSYEYMALGIPVISVAHQESNSQSAETLSKSTQGLFHLGLFDSLTPNVLNKTLIRFCLDAKARGELVMNAKKTIDLKGIERVVKIIENV
ncbi:MAG: hypothetical protein WC833_08080 [Bacteroidales bacterium]|jgi:spore coat polysaccharide biosynthesis predicted glycosyltransferase SpsG